MLELYAITSAAYDAAVSHNSDYLYFLTDVGELYRGDVSFSEACILYSGTKPTTPARKKIYIDTTTLKGEVYTGTEWVTVIKPVSATVTADGTDPVSGKAVADYVTAQLEALEAADTSLTNIAYDKATIKLTATKADGTTVPIVLEGIATQLAYDKTTGALTIKDVSGNVLGSAINLDLERFVQGGSYDATTKTITLWFDDAADAATSTDKIDIPVSDLVDTYTAGNTATVAMTVTGNKFTANVIASAAEGNLVELKDDGIYVAATDLTSYQKLVSSASTTAIPMLDANGQIINGTATIGGATISATPTATTLATELAVNALVTSTKATIDADLAKKMALVTGAVAGDVATLNADGQAIDSGTKIGGATFAATPAATTLATEAGVAAYVEAANTAALENVVMKDDIATALSSTSTDSQVASAKVVYDSLTWKTSL